MGSPPRTVYILGAGASHGSRLIEKKEYIANKDNLTKVRKLRLKVPLTKDFFAAFREGEYQWNLGRFRELVKFIVRHFGTRQEASEFKGLPTTRGEHVSSFFREFIDRRKKKGLDIEVVFTRLQAEIDRRPSRSPELWRARDQLQSLIVGKLAEACRSNHSEEYLRLCATLHRKDTVITFNWDDLIDKAFAELHYESGFVSSLSIASPSEIQHSTISGARVLRVPDFSSTRSRSTGPLLLKLHGSVTWFVCSESGCPQYNRSFQTMDLVSKLENKLRVDREPYYGIRTPQCPSCGKHMSWLIIPPIVSKPYESFPAIRKSWSEATKAMQSAERVVCIGYSFRESDVYSNWLLASSLRKWQQSKAKKLVVEVVNPPSKDVPAERLRSVLQDWVVIREVRMTFTDWIDQQE